MRLTSAVFLAVTAACAAFAQPAMTAGVINITTSPFDYPSTGGTQGFKFEVSSNFLLGSLGIYDAGYNGLIQPANVGLWSAAGELIVEAVVPGGTTGELDGQFRFVDVTPVLL